MGAWNEYYDEHVEDYKKVSFFCLLLPPFFGSLYSFYYFVKYRKIGYGVIFFVFFSLFLSYQFFSIDNGIRFSKAVGLYEEAWYLGDPLTNLAQFFMGYGIDFIYIAYSYTLLIYLFWLYAFKNNCNGHFDKSGIVVMLVTGVILHYSMNLVYYCLSVMFALFYTSRKGRIEWKDLIILIPGVYLLHPGFLLTFLPALGAYYIITHEYVKGLFFPYLLVVFLITLAMPHFSGFSSGIIFLDSVSDAYSHYVDDNYWGVRQFDISGITYFLQYYVITFFYYLIAVIALRFREKIPNPFAACLLFCTCVIIPNFWQFNTLTGRNLLVLAISGTLVAACLISNVPVLSKYYKVIVIITVVIFAFQQFRGMTAAFDKTVIFNNQSATQKVINRGYYIPSVLMFDFKEFGYSDDFLIKYSNIGIERF